MSARYAAAKRVVANCQHEEVEGRLLDLFSAAALVAVYEAMNEANQAKFDAVPFERLVAFCFQRAGVTA